MRHASAPLTLVLGLAACANAPPSAEVGEAQPEAQRSSAVVFVERQVGDGAAVSVHVGARFVQFAGISADALPDLLGTPHLAGAAPTGCSERTQANVDPDAHADARLLDVGTIEVRSGDAAVSLEPRRFPDLWNVVSGVIYASDGELSGETWHFSAPGNVQNHLAGFDFDSTPPQDPSGFAIGDQQIAPGATISVPRSAFGVRWTAGEHEDTVAVTFETPTTADHPAIIDCTAHDDGALDVDAAWAARIADVTSGGGTITMHRVRSRSFAGPQVDSASVVFDVSLRAHGE